MSSKRKSPAKHEFELSSFPPFILSVLDDHFQSSLRGILKRFDLTVLEWRVLGCLEHTQKYTINEITDFTALSQPSVSRTVEKLSKRGLLQRSWLAQDSRVAQVRISAAGRKHLNKAEAVVTAEIQGEVEDLAGEEAELWIDIMRDVMNRLRDRKG